MAIQVENQGQIQEFLGVLRRRVWQVILPAAFVLSLGIAAVVFVPYKYKVSTVLELKPVTTHSFTEVRQGDLGEFNESFRNAQAHIQHFTRVREVLEEQHWEDYATLKPDLQIEYLERLMDRIQVNVPRQQGRGSAGSTFITIHYTDTLQHRAEQFVNALRKAYVEQVVERYRHDAKTECDKLNEIRKKRKADLERAEELLLNIRQEHQISSAQEGLKTGGRNEDPIYMGLMKAKSQLLDLNQKLQGDLAVLDIVEEQLLEEPMTISEEVSDPGQSVDEEVTKQRAAIVVLKGQQAGLKPEHSQYKRIESEVARKEELIEDLLAQAQSPTNTSVEVPNPLRPQLYQRKQQLQQEIEASRASITSLDEVVIDLEAKNRERGQIYQDLSKREMEKGHALQAFEEIEYAYQKQQNLVDLISGPQGNPFEIVRPGIAPRTPTEPNPVVLLTVAILLGLAIGIGSALLAEYSRSCYRSVSDIARALNLPVLGAVNSIITRAEARRTRMRRIVIGSSSFVIIATILWITFAWKKDPALLGNELRQLIDDIQSEFR